MPDSVEFYGETFALPERIGLMPLMRFAKIAKEGADANDLDGLVAIYDLLKQCFRDEDWARFEKTADAHHCDGDELLGLSRKVIEAIAERPTSRSSDSSDGPTSTGPSSAVVSSSPVIARLEDQGRPDLALIVLEAQEHQAS